MNTLLQWLGITVVQWFALLPHSKQVLGLTPAWVRTFLCKSLHTLLVLVSPGCSCFFRHQKKKKKHIRLILWSVPFIKDWPAQIRSWSVGAIRWLPTAPRGWVKCRVQVSVCCTSYGSMGWIKFLLLPLSLLSFSVLCSHVYKKILKVKKRSAPALPQKTPLPRHLVWFTLRHRVTHLSDFTPRQLVLWVQIVALLLLGSGMCELANRRRSGYKEWGAF